MKAPFASTLIVASLMAGTASIGAEDTVEKTQDSLQCGAFATTEGPAGRVPMTSNEHERLLGCTCALNQDLLWLVDDLENSARKQAERLLRAERITKTLAEIDKLRKELTAATSDAERAVAQAELKAAFDRLAVDLGLTRERTPHGRVSLRRWDVRTAVDQLASSDRETRDAANSRIDLVFREALQAWRPRPAEEASGTESRGWLVPLPGRAIQASNELGDRALAPQDRAEYVLRAHDAYEHFQRWARSKVKDKPASGSPEHANGSDTTTAARAIDRTDYGPSPKACTVTPIRLADAMKDLGGNLHFLLDQMGMRRPMTGLLIQALGFTRTSAEGKKTDDQAAQVAVVKFETRHWSLRDLVRRMPSSADVIDFGAVGHFGVQPAFNMFQPKPDPRSSSTTTIETTIGTDGTARRVTTNTSQSREECVIPSGGKEDCNRNAKPELKPRYETALSWSLGGRGGVKIGGLAEISFVARYGQIFTQPDVAAVAEADKPPTAASLLDATSANRHFWEWGGRASLFGEARGLKGHHDLGILRPLLEVEVGRRHDMRFRNVFTDPALVEQFGAHPEDRHYLRMSLSGLEVFGSDTPFELSVAIEREWKRHDKGLPEGTKILVQGRLDVFGLVSGPKKGAKEK